MPSALSDPRIAVLLAAYNGLKWLPEQIDSILGQSGVEVTIFVSVDISSDDTESWCDKRAVQDGRVKVLPHGMKFGGAARNFFRLIRDVDFSGFDCIALADQDDIWLADKLLSAYEKTCIGNYSGYSGNVMAFWPDGRQRLIDKAQPLTRYDYYFEAAGPGCTYVMRTKEALVFQDFLRANWEAVNSVSLHDWMIYAFFRARGYTWFIDKDHKMLYRQHGNNQVGANRGLKAMLSRLKLSRSGWYRTEVCRIASLVAPASDEIARKIQAQGWLSRLALLSDIADLRRRTRDRLFLFIMILVGIY